MLSSASSPSDPMPERHRCPARSGDTCRPFVLVVHYEALQILEKAGWWKKLGEWDLVVADEAHRLKNPQALMTRAIKKIPSQARLALSGSIIQNHIEELFSVLQWLFPERYKAKWRDWNDRYLDYVESSFGRVCIGVKPDRLDAMRDELSRFMVVRYKEDELDLPDKTEQTLYVELSPKQRRAYNSS
jgi:SNF2 family DNA or RNA helicase